MSKDEILTSFGDELQATTRLYFQGYGIALDTLTRHLIRELVNGTTMPRDMLERLEQGDLSDFYAATFEQWLNWKLERDTGYIEVDEHFDETTDGVLLRSFR